jgi:GT2 family glycosyltransferase
MGLFSKRTKKPVSSKTSSWLEKAIIHRQRQIADHLNRKTQYWNRASKLILLLLICLLFGGASLWLLIRAIY